MLDSDIMTSSGVSTGSDMALALVERLYDRAVAEKTARNADYVWNDGPGDDPFTLP